METSLFKILLVVIASLTLSACQIKKSDPLALDPKDIEVPVSPRKTEPVPLDQLSYALIKTQVIDRACLECHSEKGGNKGDVNLETYESVKKNMIEMRDTVGQKKMPPRKRTDLALSDEEIKMVVDWVELGAPLEASAQQPPVEPPTTPPVTPPVVVEPPPAVVTLPTDIPATADKELFEKMYTQVIATNCLKCHSEKAAKPKEPNMDTYKNILDMRFEINFEVEQKSMPPKPPRGTPLTDEQRALVKAWFDQVQAQQ